MSLARWAGAELDDAELGEAVGVERAHVRFLQKYYASGHFLVSGRKIPRDGGIILAVAESRAEVQRIVEEDMCASMRARSAV